jgi:hypothetical protein
MPVHIPGIRLRVSKMKFLIFQHARVEHPAIFREFFAADGITLSPAGKSSPLFRDLPPVLPMLQCQVELASSRLDTELTTLDRLQGLRTSTKR